MRLHDAMLQLNARASPQFDLEPRLPSNCRDSIGSAYSNACTQNLPGKGMLLTDSLVLPGATSQSATNPGFRSFGKNRAFSGDMQPDLDRLARMKEVRFQRHTNCEI